MKKTPESYIHTLSSITLPADERASMRERLVAYADMHPMHTKAVRSPFSYMSLRWSAALATLVLVLVSGTGAAYASEKSVPGDVLYTVKRKVTEPMLVSLAVDTEAKAKLQTSFAERRLEEATKLAVADRLDAETGALLSEEIEVAAEASTALAAELEGEGNADTALAVRSDLEARLSAHAQILAVVADDPNTHDDHIVQDVADRVAQQVSVVALLRAESETAVVASAEEPTEPEQVTTATEEVEPEPTIMAAKMAPEIEEPTTMQATEIADEARALIQEDKPEEAYVRSLEASRSATEASIFEKNKGLLTKIRARIDERDTATSTPATTTPEQTEPFQLFK